MQMNLWNMIDIWVNKWNLIPLLKNPLLLTKLTLAIVKLRELLEFFASPFVSESAVRLPRSSHSERDGAYRDQHNHLYFPIDKHPILYSKKHPNNIDWKTKTGQ